MSNSANVAHDQAIDRSGSSALPPNRIGAKAAASLPTAVSADGDCVDLVATRQGQLRVYVDSMPTTTVTATLASTTSGSTHTIDVNDVSKVALTSDSTAKGWILTNNGGSVCYVALGSSATSGATSGAQGGHYLGASGGTLGMSQVDGYNGPVSVICASGNTTVVAVSRW